MVNRRRGGILSTVVVAAVATRPAVVVVVATRGIYACSDELLVKVEYGDLKLGEVLKGNEELCVAVHLAVSVLLVAVRAVTEAQSLAVAVARLAIASTVLF